MTKIAGTTRKIIPAFAIAAMLGAGALTTLTQTSTPALASAPVVGGYVDLVERVSPAVVTIEVTKKPQPAQMSGPGGTENPFEEFSRRFGMPMPNMPDNAPMRGAGTGFVISDSGQIVTNAHVVAGADEIKVTLPDGRSFDAALKGADDATDIAVIEIEAEGLTAVGFGASGELKVGENVIAIGNPFGLGNTVTTGIVSAIGRDINAGPFDDFIQTDAAINRGNSGGPLFNAQGEVVGMNTAIISPTGGSVGIGFAVPSDLVQKVVSDLSDDGKIDRGWLGVRIQPVSDDVATALGLEVARGTMIAGIEKGTPAEKAGLKKGDIVTSVNGAAVDGPRDLTRLIAGDAPGSEISLTLLRKGKEMTVEVTLGSRADQPA